MNAMPVVDFQLETYPAAHSAPAAAQHPRFFTITGDDWKRSLAAARARRRNAFARIDTRTKSDTRNEQHPDPHPTN